MLKYPCALLLFWALQSLPQSANAGLEPLPFPEVKCRDPLLEVLQEWKVDGPWQVQPTLTKNQPVYQAATEKIGAWVQIQLMPEGTVAVARVTAHHQDGLTWDAVPHGAPKTRSLTSLSPAAGPEECVPTKHKASKELFAKTKEKSFSDQDLEKLLADHPQGGLILLWSPGMEYSLVAIKNAQKAAQDLKLPLQILLDPDANPQAARESLQNAGLEASLLQVSQSLELFLRGMHNHFPSMQYYQKGRFTKDMLPGLMTAEGYTRYVKGELL